MDEIFGIVTVLSSAIVHSSFSQVASVGIPEATEEARILLIVRIPAEIPFGPRRTLHSLMDGLDFRISELPTQILPPIPFRMLRTVFLQNGLTSEVMRVLIKESILMN